MNPESSYNLESENLKSPREAGREWLKARHQELREYSMSADSLSLDFLQIESDLPRAQAESLAILASYEELLLKEGRTDAEN